MKLEEMFRIAGVDPTKGKAKRLVEQDEFGFSGQAFVFNDANEQVQTLPAVQAQNIIKKLAQATDVRPTSVEKLIDYFDQVLAIEDGITPEAERSAADMIAFLTNLEGYQTTAFEVDHGQFGLHADAHTVIIVR